jgi:hypothetical protein
MTQFEVNLKTAANLPECQLIRVSVYKRNPFLLQNGLLQVANRFTVLDVDRERGIG